MIERSTLFTLHTNFHTSSRRQQPKLTLGLQVQCLTLSYVCANRSVISVSRAGRYPRKWPLTIFLKGPRPHLMRKISIWRSDTPRKKNTCLAGIYKWICSSLSDNTTCCASVSWWGVDFCTMAEDPQTKALYLPLLLSKPIPIAVLKVSDVQSYRFRQLFQRDLCVNVLRPSIFLCI